MVATQEEGSGDSDTITPILSLSHPSSAGKDSNTGSFLFLKMYSAFVCRCAENELKIEGNPIEEEPAEAPCLIHFSDKMCPGLWHLCLWGLPHDWPQDIVHRSDPANHSGYLSMFPGLVAGAPTVGGAVLRQILGSGNGSLLISFSVRVTLAQPQGPSSRASTKVHPQ